MMQGANQEMAKMTLEFLNRVDLKGSEVQAFMACQQWLIKTIQPPAPVEPPKKGETKG